MGDKRYKEMIDRDSKRADTWSNLPFTFSKPAKRTQAIRDILFSCPSCERVTGVSKYTVGIVCVQCKTYTTISEENTFHNQEELEEVLNVRDRS